MRLRYVETTDFRRSELTCWLDIVSRRPELRRLKGEDVVLLVSMSGDQLVFLHGFSEVRGKEVLRSTRFRIQNSQWNPMMLANYAKAAGIQLAGLKTYEEHVERLLKEARSALEGR